MATAAAVQQVLNWFGWVQADGSVTFDSKSFHLAQSENFVTIASQGENREILRTVINEFIFNLTLQDRQNLQNLCERVSNVLSQEQQQQRKQMWSLWAGSSHTCIFTSRLLRFKDSYNPTCAISLALAQVELSVLTWGIWSTEANTEVDSWIGETLASVDQM